MDYNRKNQDTDQEQEYHVNSGFVNKLRSKFAQWENNNTNKIVLSKRSASVENLLLDTSKPSSDYSSRLKNRHGSAGRSSIDDTNVSSSRSSNVILRKAATQGFKKPDRPTSYESRDKKERPRSNELINKSADKPPVPKQDFSKPNHVIRSMRPPLPKKKEGISMRSPRNSSSEYSTAVPKIEHHDWTIAPDLEIVGRDNLVIIESSVDKKENEKNEKKQRDSSQTDIDEIDGVTLRAKPIRDKQDNENELPKPHTVSAFRSFFEKANKASDTVRTWQSLSPTRKTAGSDASSPRVMSPINSPRSPFEKVNDDNVFTLGDNKDSQPVSQRKSSIDKSSVNKSSPRNSAAAFVPDVDTTSTSLEKSRQMFQKKSVDKAPSVEKDDINFKNVESASSSHTLTPLSNVSEVFDSKAIKSKKLNRPKPIVLARKSKEFSDYDNESNSTVPKKNIPRDTIELKHERESSVKSIEKNTDTTLDFKYNLSKGEVNNSVTKSKNEDILNESLVKPSKKHSGKISPRKTKIFDSSNMIVKKDKEPPKSPVSPIPSPFADKPVDVPISKPKPVEPVVNDTKGEETQMETPPVRPSRGKKPAGNKLPSSGMTPLSTNIVKNDSKTHADARSPRSNKPEPVFPVPKPNEPVPAKRSQKSTPEGVDESPQSGMSSFLASRLKKSDNDNISPLKTKSVHLVNGSSPVPKKRQAPPRPPVENGFAAQSNDVEMKDKEQIPPALPETPEPKLPEPKPKSNIDDAFKRKNLKSSSHSSTKMVFDSSKIVTKRKEPPKRKPPRKTLQELNENITFDPAPVPKLDLSCITGEKQETEYQEGYIPTVITPCNIKFVGEGVVTKKTPYKRTRNSKVKISFDDHATTTFEYEGEDSALENYLRDHPEERDEVLKQEEEVNVSSNSTEELLNDSPRAPELEQSTMKSNTVIGGSSGALTSYKSKMQTQEFQFGMSMEPELDAYNSQETEVAVDEDSMQLLPADDNDLDMFSAEVGKADMLF